ncbi:MAG: hypothetical protein IJ605_02315 [Prevotella sp.]|nr:hypothetical protein [Prevotella sp.]
MNNIAIYTLTSELHDEKAVDAVTKAFLESLSITYDFMGSDFSTYGSRALSLIYVRTGGTEGIFRQLLPTLQAQSESPFYLLTSGKSNSLAASMEILSYLQQMQLKGEILHGTPSYIVRRISLLEKAEAARKKLRNCRLGVIGQPSDWLISSTVNRAKVKEKLGIELIDIPMATLLERVQATPAVAPAETSDRADIQQNLPGANSIYQALKTIVADYQLQGFTLRCFDLLTEVKNTGCLALAKLNSEGIVAGCEGDIPALLSMTIVNSLLGISGFQANPSTIDPETGQMLFAHCTIPLNMVENYEFDTHFESGIGVGIRGRMKEGPVTLFKVSGDLSRHFAEEGLLVKNQAECDLCRTQQVIQLADRQKTAYFLTNPIGNHHVILPGHHKELLEEILK